MKNFTYILLLFPTLIFSQIVFDDEKILIDNTHFNAEVIAVVVDDMDNDGDKDVIAASKDDSQVLMYENFAGDLLYNPRILITDNAEYPKDLYVSDLDNDGLKDIIVTSGSGDKIIWFKNLTGNTFSDKIILLDNIYRPKKIVCVDIDNDGDNDIFFNSSQDDNVFLLKNDGFANFSNPEVVVSINGDGEVLNAIDINNDGLLDIISSNWSDTFYWSRNLGNGLFDEKQGLGYGNDLAFYDINNDNYLDAIGVDDYDNEVYYYLNQGGISFGNRISITTAYEDPFEVEVSDMDNDGISDIVVVFSNDIHNGSLGWFKNMGNETFGTLNIISTEVKFPRILRTADIDNDGKQDVLFRDKNLFYKFSWYKNIDDYSFKENVINFNFASINCVRVADINNDGKKDILAGQQKITWCENYGNNKFSAPKIISNSDNVDQPFTYDMEIIDIDNDNDLDVISLIYRQIDIYENLGNGDFTLQSSISFSHPTESSTEIEIGDLDGDGIFDIAMTLTNSGIGNKMGWYRNLGDNTFAPFIPLNFPGQYEYYPGKFKIGDIDNDGDNDIVTSTEEWSKIHTLINDGNGNFSIVAVSQNLPTYRLILDDVDNDGDLDVITSAFNYSDTGIHIRKNNNGIFGDTFWIDALQEVDDIFLSDINNDGFKDLVATSHVYSKNENQIFYYLNNGSAFGQKTIIDSKDYEVGSIKFLYVEDINNDNKKDILSGQLYQDQTLSLYTNESILSIDDSNLLNEKNSIFYPNPFSNTLNWIIPNSNNFYDIDILNIQGATVYSVNTYEETNISLSFLNPGMYFIRLSSNSQCIVKKIIKK